MDYIIVQAGGKGTRLEYLTKNKPKALVPINNLPMIFHLFKRYPEKRFIIIADYKKEVMHEYLSCFANVKYQVVDAEGTGTCSGILQAVQLIPDDKSFMLIWADLVLPESFHLPDEYVNDGKALNDYIGISKTFQCRWNYTNEVFNEEKSFDHGVAGFFLFTDKNKLSKVPQSGELVRWMQQSNMKFKELSLAGTREFGIIEEYKKLTTEKCRPFNKITVEGGIFTKEAKDLQGKKLAERECRWYNFIRNQNIDIIPKVYSTNPLKMEYIKGNTVYELNLDLLQKKEILKSLVNSLKKIHTLKHTTVDTFSIKEAYFNKTMNRISTVQDLIPHAREEFITINGRKCRNVFYYKRELEKKIENIKCKEFSFIHGDCTFSNLMIRDSGEVVLIDPRGYFGFTELYGDERYDWAKLYYSVVGNYDQFNLKNFTLDISDEVTIKIQSNGWENTESTFFDLTGADKNEIKLLHAIIWLSLTTYAWQDYDSVCGAFYNGLYYLEEVL